MCFFLRHTAQPSVSHFSALVNVIFFYVCGLVCSAVVVTLQPYALCVFIYCVFVTLLINSCHHSYYLRIVINRVLLFSPHFIPEVGVVR